MNNRNIEAESLEREAKKEMIRSYLSDPAKHLRRARELKQKAMDLRQKNVIRKTGRGSAPGQIEYSHPVRW